MRIPLDIIDHVDRLRGLVPRVTFICDQLDKALRTLEQEALR